MACNCISGGRGGIGVFDYLGRAIRSDTDFVCHVTRWSCAKDFPNIVINEWREQIEGNYHQAMQSWYSPVSISLEIGDGDNWNKSIQSIDWHPNEMLVIGFNKGEVLKHFLSSKNVEKILRYAFVPRLVLPRVIS